MSCMFIIFGIHACQTAAATAAYVHAAMLCLCRSLAPWTPRQGFGILSTDLRGRDVLVGLLLEVMGCAGLGFASIVVEPWVLGLSRGCM